MKKTLIALGILGGALLAAAAFIAGFVALYERWPDASIFALLGVVGAAVLWRGFLAIRSVL